MTTPTTIKSGKLIVSLGDGGAPEVFAAPCGFTEKSFNLSKTLNETNVPDCDDPDAPVVVERDVASTSWSVSGQGVLAYEALATWLSFFDSTDSRNIKIELVFPAHTYTFTGAAHLESLEIGATVGNRVTLNVSLQADGALTES